MNSILVIGSSGNVGRALTGELVRAGEHVRAATRNPSRLKATSGVEPVAFDYDDQNTFATALEGTNRVFLLGPPTPTPHEVMIPFLESAARGKRKFVLMTAMGTEFDDSGSLRRVELSLERSGAPFVILRPNWFMDNFHTSWLDPIRQAGVIPLPAADSRTSLIDARDIGASAAAALRTDRFDGRAFTLTGPDALTYAEAAAVLSEAAGREIHYVPVDDESFVASLIEAGVPDDLARYLAALFAFGRQGATALVSAGVKELTGQAPRTLKQYAQDHASSWR
ncbi:MAG: SDR family oxidoreductase [Bryobacterales bacterium]